MSRAKKPAPKRASAARPHGPRVTAPARRTPRALGVLVVAVLVAIAAGTWWTFGAKPRSASDPAASSDPDQAAKIGVQHLSAGELVAAVPWLRRGTHGAGGDLWSRQYNLALALGRVTVLSESRAGVDLPLVRSSIERVEMARECEAAFARARELVTTPADRAIVETANAEFEFAWGRMWEAFVLFRQAQADTPADTALARRADWFQLLLEKPGRFETVEESMRAAAAR